MSLPGDNQFSVAELGEVMDINSALGKSVPFI